MVKCECENIRIKRANVDHPTAWMLLHKFRRAMVNLERESLRGKVESTRLGLF